MEGGREREGWAGGGRRREGESGRRKEEGGREERAEEDSQSGGGDYEKIVLSCLFQDLSFDLEDEDLEEDVDTQV